MPPRHDEDLFKDTTMTFGEHLEELRACLFKALIGLVIGFLIGLLVADRVVAFIEGPLTKALKEHYINHVATRLQGFKARGETVPDAKEVEALATAGYIPSLIYLPPRELARELRRQFPGKFDTAESTAGALPAPTSRKELLPLLIWTHIDDDPRVNVQSLSPHEPFMIYVKAALVFGAVISSPWVFVQIWSFVAAGLYPHEKRYVHLFVPISIALFLAGAATAFFFVFQPVLKYLLYFNELMHIDPDIRIGEWLTFALLLPIGFGISFQLPLVMLFLERIGIFTVEAYLAKWRVAILVIFVVAMVLTPAEPTSMLLMAIPLCFLYYLGIGLCKLLPRKAGAFE
ncbi:MAG: twin-arginine translocase subunit TatC [Planctomycetes bacterium]|nr:twin-arginine translocase subunit TatC [Planctomycetota bacterium]